MLLKPRGSPAERRRGRALNAVLFPGSYDNRLNPAHSGEPLGVNLILDLRGLQTPRLD